MDRRGFLKALAVGVAGATVLPVASLAITPQALEPVAIGPLLMNAHNQAMAKLVKAMLGNAENLKKLGVSHEMAEISAERWRTVMDGIQRAQEQTLNTSMREFLKPQS